MQPTVIDLSPIVTVIIAIIAASLYRAWFLRREQNRIDHVKMAQDAAKARGLVLSPYTGSYVTREHVTHQRAQYNPLEELK